MQKEINELKKKVFYEMLNISGRVFILIRYSENVVIGKRGFTEEEKNNGIVLVFNKRMNFFWDEDGISTTLVFGTTPERCFIPSEDIILIFSPELRSQFIISPETVKDKSEDKKRQPSEKDNKVENEKVVRVDFSRKKRPQ